jgi:polyisoprenoid-binding protein YceI
MAGTLSLLDKSDYGPHIEPQLDAAFVQEGCAMSHAFHRVRKLSFVRPVVSVIVAGLASMATAGAALGADWEIDPGHSRVGFGVRHMMVSTTRGTFGKYTGKLAIDDADVTRSTVAVDIDAASIDTGNRQRDDHLRSADFFDVARFPTITFRSKRVEKTEGGLRVSGDLTLHGVSRPAVLDVTSLTKEVKDPWGGVRRGAVAETKINRKDFGLTWNKAVEGGGLVVGDEVSIALEVELVKKSDAKK